MYSLLTSLLIGDWPCSDYGQIPESGYPCIFMHKSTPINLFPFLIHEVNLLSCLGSKIGGTSCEVCKIVVGYAESLVKQKKTQVSYILLYYIILYYIILYYIIFIIAWYIMLYYVILYYIIV